MTTDNDDGSGWAVPAPAFRPEQALDGLRRALRDLKPLTERGTGFELRAQRVVELAAGSDGIEARLAKRPARSPEWRSHTLSSAADVRRFVDLVRKELRGWESDE
jgi:hypothetical protein